MSTVIQTLPHTPAAGATPTVAPSSVPVAPRADVVVGEPGETITIPGWIDTLDDYRRWAESDGYPRSGWVSYLDGAIWVDPSREEFFSHNQIKGAFYFALGQVLNDAGVFVPDRMLYVNEPANLATEPDGLFYLWGTMRTGRLRLVEGKTLKGFWALSGTPDGVLEIVSNESETKDLVRLRVLYAKAQIAEYWLIDVRSELGHFDILRLTEDGYHSAPSAGDWVHSVVLGRAFRIERSSDPLGYPKFIVHVK